MSIEIFDDRRKSNSSTGVRNEGNGEKKDTYRRMGKRLGDGSDGMESIWNIAGLLGKALLLGKR